MVFADHRCSSNQFNELEKSHHFTHCDLHKTHGHAAILYTYPTLRQQSKNTPKILHIRIKPICFEETVFLTGLVFPCNLD